MNISPTNRRKSFGLLLVRFKLFCVVLLLTAFAIGCSKKDSPPEAAPPPQPVQSEQLVQSVPHPHRPPVTAQQQVPNLPPTPKMLPTIEVANQKYRAIAYPTPKSEVLRVLGKPRMKNEEGGLIWQTAEGVQVISFTAEFRPDGTMSSKKIDVIYDRTVPPITNAPWPDFPRNSTN
jgi:hypothetical protein